MATASASIVLRPDLLSPVIGGLNYRLDSASASITDFKYIIDLFTYNDAGATTSLVNRFRLPPRPDNYGEMDVSKPLRGKMRYSYNTGMVGFNIPTNSGLTNECIYGIVPGVEFAYGATFADSYFGSTGSFSLGYTFSQPHGLLLGDIITVDKFNKQINPQYDGTQSVMIVFNAYHIGVDRGFGNSSTNEQGQLSYLLRMGATADSKRVTFNGTRQYEDNGENFLYKYCVGTASTTARLPLTEALTIMTSPRKVSAVGLTGIGDYETISLITGTGNDAVTSAVIRSYSPSATLLSTATVSNSVTTVNLNRMDFGVGPANLYKNGINILSSSYYTLEFYRGTKQASKTYRYNIDTDNCNYTNYRLFWQNSLGGTDFFNFKLDSTNSIDVNRTEFKKTLDFDYTLSDNSASGTSPRGRQILSQKVASKVIINSDWLTEAESNWLGEILKSTSVNLLTTHTNFSGVTTAVAIPIMIIDSGYTYKTYLRNQLFNLSLTFEYANGIRVQNQ